VASARHINHSRSANAMETVSKARFPAAWLAFLQAAVPARAQVAPAQPHLGHNKCHRAGKLPCNSSLRSSRSLHAAARANETITDMNFSAPPQSAKSNLAIGLPATLALANRSWPRFTCRSQPITLRELPGEPRSSFSKFSNGTALSLTGTADVTCWVSRPKPPSRPPRLSNTIPTPSSIQESGSHLVARNLVGPPRSGESRF